MLFKISSKNPYRDFVRNCRRIALSKVSAQTKVQHYKELYEFIGSKMLENERFLNSSPAFSARCAHWNQIDIRSIKPVTNTKNPWLLFKREFETAMKSKEGADYTATSISKALAWFYNTQNKEDWAT